VVSTAIEPPASMGPDATVRGPGGSPGTPALGDVVLGVATAGVILAVGATRRFWRIAEPVARVGLRPPLVPVRYQPAGWLAGLACRAADRGALTRVGLSRALDLLVPAITSQLLARLDLNAIVEQSVDLDALVGTVDLDAAAARLDVDAVAARLDVDAVAARLDLDAVAQKLDLEAVLDRLDLTALVAQRVDLNRLVNDVDLDAVAARLDVDGVVRTVDLDAIIARVDLVGLAEQVINAIDLPEIIRESTGSVASDTVRGARMQGIAADDAVGEAVSRAVDRLRFRRNRTAPAGPGEQP
jgi:hypothetical protein